MLDIPPELVEVSLFDWPYPPPILTIPNKLTLPPTFHALLEFWESELALKLEPEPLSVDEA